MSDRWIPSDPAVDLAFPVTAAAGEAILVVDHREPVSAGRAFKVESEGAP